MILQTLNADVKFLPETSWSEVRLFSFPVRGRWTPRRQRVFMYRGTIWRNRRALGSSACFCGLDSVSSAFPSPVRETNGAASTNKRPTGGDVRWRFFPRSIKVFPLCFRFVARGSGRRPPPSWCNSVAERWTPTLFCSFPHCCPAESRSECAVYRDESGARRVSLSSNRLVFFSCFFAIWIFFSQNSLCFIWWVSFNFNLLPSGVPG